jgi:NADH-quinone oxidoreductase subunit F
VKEAGTLEVDRYTLETSRERFYAGGDLITGASNVSNAMGYGQEGRPQDRPAADGRRPLARSWPPFEYSMEPPEIRAECRRHVPREVPAGRARDPSSVEVSLGLDPGGGPRGDLPLPALRHPRRRTLKEAPA